MSTDVVCLRRLSAGNMLQYYVMGQGMDNIQTKSCLLEMAGENSITDKSFSHCIGTDSRSAQGSSISSAKIYIIDQPGLL